ncbi:MAG: hypothetical protein ACLT9Y_07425, partial [Peptostreptococcus anaerobius]
IYTKEENEEEIRQLSFDFVLERESKKNIPMDEQIDLSPYKDIISEIKNIDMMNTTPLQLMNILYQLQDKAKKIK